MAFNIDFSPTAIVNSSDHAQGVGSTVLSPSTNATMASGKLIKMSGNVVSRVTYPQLAAVTPIDQISVGWDIKEIEVDANDVKFGGTYYAIPTNGGYVYKATNANSWTKMDIASSSGIDFTAIVYVSFANRWVVVGRKGTLYASTNASMTTWAVKTSNFSDSDINGVAENGTHIVAVGNDGKMRASTNVDDWNVPGITHTFGTSRINDIIYDGTRFVAVGNDGKIEYSTSGTSWTAASSPSFGTSNVLDIAHDGSSTFVAVGGDGKIATSSDGSTWTQQSSPFDSTKPITSVGYMNGQFIATSATEMSVSSDGITWVSTSTVGKYFGYTDYNAFIYESGTYVMAGKYILSGTSYTSSSDIYLPNIFYDIDGTNRLNTYIRAEF